MCFLVQVFGRCMYAAQLEVYPEVKLVCHMTYICLAFVDTAK